METNHISENPPHCLGVDCDYAVDMSSGEGLCLSGSGTCLVCNLLEAEPSKLHDHDLVTATKKIRQIISAIPKAADGSELAFLVTKKGILLARVHHGKTVPAHAVTAKDDEATVAKALKLKH